MRRSVIIFVLVKNYRDSESTRNVLWKRRLTHFSCGMSMVGWRRRSLGAEPLALGEFWHFIFITMHF